MKPEKYKQKYKEVLKEYTELYKQNMDMRDTLNHLILFVYRHPIVTLARKIKFFESDFKEYQLPLPPEKLKNKKVKK